jgi:hypothetical protein
MGDMEELVIAIFLLLVNITLVAAFAPYIIEAISKIPEYATPIGFGAAFGKGLLSQMFGIQTK